MVYIAITLYNNTNGTTMMCGIMMEMMETDLRALYLYTMGNLSGFRFPIPRLIR